MIPRQQPVPPPREQPVQPMQEQPVLPLQLVHEAKNSSADDSPTRDR